MIEERTETQASWMQPHAPHEEDSWPRCQGVGGNCGVTYPPDWPELAWHLVHQCCRAEISDCPGEGCLCLEPLVVIQHWCESCDGEDPRTCPKRAVRTEAHGRRMRGCWYGDRDTHAVAPKGINNMITVCGKYVDDRRAKECARSAPVTCEPCSVALRNGGWLADA